MTNSEILEAMKQRTPVVERRSGIRYKYIFEYTLRVSKDGNMALIAGLMDYNENCIVRALIKDVEIDPQGSKQ